MPDLIVHFKKPQGWQDTIKIHYWNTAPPSSTTTWPGTSMTAEGNDWFVYRFEGISLANMVFNDGMGQQTGDLQRDREGWFFDDNRWYDRNPQERDTSSLTTSSEGDTTTSQTAPTSSDNQTSNLESQDAQTPQQEEKSAISTPAEEDTASTPQTAPPSSDNQTSNLESQDAQTPQQEEKSAISTPVEEDTVSTPQTAPPSSDNQTSNLDLPQQSPTDKSESLSKAKENAVDSLGKTDKPSADLTDTTTDNKGDRDEAKIDKDFDSTVEQDGLPPQWLRKVGAVFVVAGAIELLRVFLTLVWLAYNTKSL